MQRKILGSLHPTDAKVLSQRRSPLQNTVASSKVSRCRCSHFKYCKSVLTRLDLI